MSILTFDSKKLYLDGEPFYMISGDIHYFRIYRGGIRRRLELAKAFGLNTVQTYVPWNVHEPENGKFCFDGIFSLTEFLKEADTLGLKVLLRPSPFICSEWDKGGLPYWLSNENLTPRSNDERYLYFVKRYYKELCKQFVPYLSTNGGPIIAVAIENEYGGYAYDPDYLRALANILTENGVNVPFYTTDGNGLAELTYGSHDDFWRGVNYSENVEVSLSRLNSLQKDKPPFVGEFWCGRGCIHWGENFKMVPIKHVADTFKETLEKGAYVNFYMFAGGTNYGFMNGANFGTSRFSNQRPSRYIPIITSYADNSLLDEQGLPTEKYFACKKVLWEFLGKPEPETPEIPAQTQVIEPFKVKYSHNIWDIAKESKAQKSSAPLYMEQLGQAYGFCLYETELVSIGEKTNVFVQQLRDRADIYVNDDFAGTLMRERNLPAVTFEKEAGQKLKIKFLVENLGRINNSTKNEEKKGLSEYVHFNGRRQFGWNNTPLDLGLTPTNKSPFDGKIKPSFYCGEFTADTDKDIFLDMSDWNKGVVFVNGFNLGRYWSIGPQLTLFVPRELLRE